MGVGGIPWAVSTLSGPPALRESERPQVNPARAGSTQSPQSWGLYRGFRILLALLAWITLSKHLHPLPLLLSEAPTHRPPPSLMGRWAHLYPGGPLETRCTRNWKEQPPEPSSQASLGLHQPKGRTASGSTPRWLPFMRRANTPKVTRDPETSTGGDTVPQGRAVNVKSLSPWPPHLPCSATSVMVKTQQMYFLSILPSLGVGKLKISDAFQKAHRMPPSVLPRGGPRGVEITIWPLLFEEGRGSFYSKITF